MTHNETEPVRSALCIWLNILPKWITVPWFVNQLLRVSDARSVVDVQLVMLSSTIPWTLSRNLNRNIGLFELEIYVVDCYGIYSEYYLYLLSSALQYYLWYFVSYHIFRWASCKKRREWHASNVKNAKIVRRRFAVSRKPRYPVERNRKNSLLCDRRIFYSYDEHLL